MVKTVSRKLVALAATGLILGLAYTAYTVFTTVISPISSPDQPVVLGFSIAAIQFWIMPAALTIILGYIAALLTQDDRLTMVFLRTYRASFAMRWKDEPQPILGVSGAILGAVFFGTFIALIGLLSLASGDISDTFGSILINAEPDMAMTFLIARAAGVACIAGACGVGIFFFAFRKNSMVKKGYFTLNFIAEILVSRPLSILIMLGTFMFGYIVPVDFNATGTLTLDSPPFTFYLVVLLMIVASFPVEYCIYKLAERLFDDPNNGEHVGRVNTVVAAMNIVLFLLVMVSPAIFSVMTSYGNG